MYPIVEGRGRCTLAGPRAPEQQVWLLFIPVSYSALGTATKDPTEQPRPALPVIRALAQSGTNKVP